MNLLTQLICNTDSYKPSHWLQYKPGTTGVFAYLESRGGKYDKTLFFGLQILLKEYLSKPVTMKMIKRAEKVLTAHGVPFNKAGWLRLIEKHNGYLPLIIRAVPEGLVIPTHNVLITIENTDPEFYWLPTYIETMIVREWYPTTVATNSWHIKQIIKKYLEETADTLDKLPFMFHDFGARGVTCAEQAAIGGAAHLVNFMGTDTLFGILAVQDYYADEDYMPGFSIPAAEHSTMSSWGGPEGELDAMKNMLDQFAKPGTLVAVVSDTYDIYNACKNYWGDKLKQQVLDSGATIVVRPDSGYPPTMVVEVLDMLDESYGHTINSKGYMVLHDSIRVIQGDGMDVEMLVEVLDEIKASGYSVENLAFGCGGGLLQKMDRDTQKFAQKASAVCVDGKWIDAFKDPITDKGKISKKGRLALYRDIITNDYITGREAHEADHLSTYDPVLETVFLDGKVVKEYHFDEVRANSEL